MIKEGSVIYRLLLCLRKGDGFSGLVDLEFDLVKPVNEGDLESSSISLATAMGAKELFLDFSGSKVCEIEVNSVPLS